MGHAAKEQHGLAALLWLGLAVSCATAHPAVPLDSRPRSQLRPEGSPLHTVSTEGPAACVSGAVRLGHRACTVRQNNGVNAQRCVGSTWQDVDECRCAGQVQFLAPALLEAISNELKLKGPLQAERADAVRTLNLRGQQSLEGLECFHELEKLDLSYGQVTDLTPLRTLSQLVELNVSSNKLSNISPLAGLPRLERLLLYNNQIEDLSPLAGQSSLRNLSVDQNRVRNLAPLIGLTKLEELYAHSNRILDLSPLRTLTDLMSLGVGSNCITDLAPVAGLSKLRALSASFNYIKELAPLGAMTQLETLILSGNHIKNFEPIKNLYDLRSLFVDSTDQSDVSALTELRRFERIVIQRNPIDCDAQANNIRLMEENAKFQGGEVFHDCTPKARRARQQGFRDPLGIPAVRNKARDPACARD